MSIPIRVFSVKKTFVYSLHIAQDISNSKQNITHKHTHTLEHILVNTFSCNRSQGGRGWTLGSSYRVYLHSSSSEEPPAPAGAHTAYRAHRALKPELVTCTAAGQRRYRSSFNGQRGQCCLLFPDRNTFTHERWVSREQFRSRWGWERPDGTC